MSKTIQHILTGAAFLVMLSMVLLLLSIPTLTPDGAAQRKDNEAPSVYISRLVRYAYNSGDSGKYDPLNIYRQLRKAGISADVLNIGGRLYISATPAPGLSWLLDPAAGVILYFDEQHARKNPGLVEREYISAGHDLEYSRLQARRFTPDRQPGEGIVEQSADDQRLERAAGIAAIGALLVLFMLYWLERSTA